MKYQADLLKEEGKILLTQKQHVHLKNIIFFCFRYFLPDAGILCHYPYSDLKYFLNPFIEFKVCVALTEFP